VPPLEPEEAEVFVQALAAGGDISGWTDATLAPCSMKAWALYASILQRGFEKSPLAAKAAVLDRFPDIFALKVRPVSTQPSSSSSDIMCASYRRAWRPPRPYSPRLLETALTTSSPISRDELIKQCGQRHGGSRSHRCLEYLQEDGFLTPRIERSGRQTWSAASTLVTAWWTQRRGGVRVMTPSHIV